MTNSHDHDLTDEENIKERVRQDNDSSTHHQLVGMEDSCIPYKDIVSMLVA